jgi:hypothetical protein
MLGKAHSMCLGAYVSAIPHKRAFPRRLDARVSVIPLSKDLSRHQGSCPDATPLEQPLSRCLVARFIVFLPVSLLPAVLMLV